MYRPPHAVLRAEDAGTARGEGPEGHVLDLREGAQLLVSELPETEGGGSASREEEPLQAPDLASLPRPTPEQVRTAGRRPGIAAHRATTVVARALATFGADGASAGAFEGEVVPVGQVGLRTARKMMSLAACSFLTKEREGKSIRYRLRPEAYPKV